MVLSKILGGSLVDTVGKVIDSVHTSEEEKGQIRIKLQELENEINSKQMDINLADAQSTATDISGLLQRSWRPLIGFSAALAIFFEYVLKPFRNFSNRSWSSSSNGYGTTHAISHGSPRNGRLENIRKI